LESLEVEVANLLIGQNGFSTRVITEDGEHMLMTEVMQVPSPIFVPTDEHYRYAKSGGIPLSGKGKSRYFFLSSEIARIEDASTGAVIFTRCNR